MRNAIFACAAAAALLSACGRDPDAPVSADALNSHLEQRMALEEAEKNRSVAEARERERVRAEEADARVHGLKPGNRH